jgi:hypothetical protein
MVLLDSPGTLTQRVPGAGARFFVFALCERKNDNKRSGTAVLEPACPEPACPERSRRVEGPKGCRPP